MQRIIAQSSFTKTSLFHQMFKTENQSSQVHHKNTINNVLQHQPLNSLVFSPQNTLTGKATW